jgi:hypothetical protein
VSVFVVNQDQREKQDLPVFQATMELQARMAFLVHPVFQVSTANQVIKI